ncbi:cyclic pyranopterin monophosphate synthase MoaC [Macrococcus hajekii]|uniref:Cyclic pyranopterin monophosphate synthase n=1 Tax=Macrococcus hajekii TaxID=198482 RepID=A0A4R6BJS7_9STAP|nr:cyclic pyranopterin monophosphate synthase MoaC [Macrococcus hajekii]TDM01897.1 cyclic pyranopterin monophosphate synthase MoaC [Macrococcus hajekii]GGB08371.1 cyclic pyranopterin monophosphate synthase accessory protein [Macrococcus hajekii]
MNQLTHFNEEGRARMVDVSDKEVTTRVATAISSIEVNAIIYDQIIHHTAQKGDVLAVAQVAGIMAAKDTSRIIPMCHPLQLSGIDIHFNWQNTENKYILEISCTVKTKGMTGVEMEALTGASVTALTIYDMTKAVDKGMIIGPTYLKSKSGGKNGDFSR